MSYVNALWSPTELKTIHDTVNQWIKDELQQDSFVTPSWVCREVSNQISIYEKGLSSMNRPRETHVEYVRNRVIDQLKHSVFHYFLSAQEYKRKIDEGVKSALEHPKPTRSTERRLVNEHLPALVVSRPEIFCDEPPRGQTLQLAFGSDAIVESDPSAAALPFRTRTG
jgi:hypothetical protein